MSDDLEWLITEYVALVEIGLGESVEWEWTEGETLLFTVKAGDATVQHTHSFGTKLRSGAVAGLATDTVQKIKQERAARVW